MEISFGRRVELVERNWCYLSSLHLPRGAKCYPMKVVLTLKPVPKIRMKKKKARACVCGNYQEKLPTDLLYTANIDITSIRLVLAIAAQYADWGITVMDVVTAF